MHLCNKITSMFSFSILGINIFLSSVRSSVYMSSWFFLFAYFNLCTNQILPTVSVRLCDRGLGASSSGNLGQARETAASQGNKVRYTRHNTALCAYMLYELHVRLISTAECWYQWLSWVALTAWSCLLSWKRTIFSRVAHVSIGCTWHHCPDILLLLLFIYPVLQD